MAGALNANGLPLTRSGVDIIISALMLEVGAALDVICIFRTLFAVWLVLKLAELFLPEAFEPSRPEREHPISNMIRKVFG